MSEIDTDREARQWAMFLHLSLLGGFLIPGLGFIAPIIIWQIKKDELPTIDSHGKIAVNWLISSLIYGTVCVLLSFVLIGIPLLLILGVLSVVFPIMGGIKANNGKLWKYPLSISFL